MTHHTNDPLGSEGSRPQDAVPIDEAGRLPTEPRSERASDRADDHETREDDDLKGLAGLAAANSNPSNQPEKTRTPRRRRNTSRGAAGEAAPAQPAATPPTEADAVRDLENLETQGFTPDEAQRLIDITARLNQSAEAREAEATLRRLQFTRWLLDHGRLDEWSA